MFDGQVFLPDSPPNLEPNTRYTIKIEFIEPVAQGNAWNVLGASLLKVVDNNSKISDIQVIAE